MSKRAVSRRKIRSIAEPPKSALPYLERISSYYAALGYGAPYRWARFDDVPFVPLPKPLAQCRIAIVTTAAPFQPGKGDQGPGAAYNGAAKFYEVYASAISPAPDLRISHIAYDRDHTDATDPGTYFPLKVLQALEQEGVIGAVAPVFYGLPTNRSQRTTLQVDCPALVEFCQRDHVDAVILVPNCPVCHQSTSLAARTLEEAGIPTVIMGAARDIVEHVGVPRLLFSNLPLGNSAGPPHDPKAQEIVARMAVDLLRDAVAARTTRVTPLQWQADPNWQESYSNAARLSAEEIARRRAEFDKSKSAAKAVREGG